jgi:hypothetical protein
MTLTEPAAETTAPAAPVGTPFNILIVVEGVESCDGRLFELGSSEWRQLPIPYMVQNTAPHGPGQLPDPAWSAGQIDEWIQRDPTDPTRILGRGHLMPNAAGRQAEELARGGFRGVSVDAYLTGPLGQPGMQVTHVNQKGEPVAALTRYDSNMIARVTQVPTPAIEGCCIWFDDEEMPEAARNVHGAAIPSDVPPEVITIAPGNMSAFEQMVAAGGGPFAPPREWFFTPEPDHYQPVEVTADGHWSGHIARKGQCYLGSGVKCRTAPPSTSVPPYKGFHRTVAQCADGTRVACGWVAMDTKHAPELHGVTQGQVADQYDHTGTLGAKIRCSNGKHGVWSSGAILPGLPERALAILQGPEVSGDWRHWTDPDTGTSHALELLGVLGVPFPAFPGTRTRPELLVASGGEIIGQRGSILPCDDDEGEPMNVEERAEFDAMAARVDVLERQNEALVAAAGPEVAAAVAAALVDEPAAAGNLDGPSDSAEIAAAVDTEITSAEVAPIDLSQQLSGVELAQYVGRYDDKDRQVAASDGRALPDGSMMIEDSDDLFAAARMWDGGLRARRHLERAAARLGRTDITFGTDVMFARYTDDDIAALRDRGLAMPALSRAGAARFAIGDAEDLGRAIGMTDALTDVEAPAVRKHLIAAAATLELPELIPSTWDANGMLVHESAEAV